MFAALLLILYGLGAADRYFSDSKSLESNQFYSVIGKITKVIENENSTKLYIERARVIGQDGTTAVTGILCNTADGGYIRGDTVSFEAELYGVSRPENPGEFNLQHYYASQNIFYQASPEQITVKQKCRNPWVRFVFSLKKRLYETYQNIAAPKDAGVCISMVLGDKSLLADEIQNMFQKNGIAHILAISGLHISLIGLTLYRLIRKAGVNFSVSAAVCVSVMLSYGMMTGNSISTIRAVVMFGVSVYAEVFGRTYDSISAICLSASVIMLRYPYCIYNAGFYLSFGAVLGIVLVAPAVITCFGIKNSFLKGFLVSLSVTLATLPVLSYFYYEIPIYSVILNIAVIPCMGLLIASALLAGFAGMLCIPLGIFLMGPASYIIRFYEVICKAAQNLPGAVKIIGAPKEWQILMYVFLLGTAVLLAAHCKKRGAYVFILGTAAAVYILTVRPKSDMEIVMLSVGQGDCMYISCKEYAILIDGGSSSKKNIGKYTIIPFLKYKGIDSLDYVVLTHSDSDHYSGLTELLEDKSIKVQKFILPDIKKPDEAYTKVRDIAAQSAKKVDAICAGELLVEDGLRILCLHPSKGYAYTSTNDYSLAFHVSYGQFDLITTGDMEAAGELSVLNSFKLNKAEVLKCGHHGSSTATGAPWLSALQPEIALISCGRNNRYGHPHEEVLERIEQSGCDIYRTDECGAVTIYVNNNRITVETFVE